MDPWIVGSLAGLAATLVMTVIELAARSRWGLEALLDWQQDQTVMAWVTGRAVEGTALPGFELHLLHGLLLGLLFVLLLPLFPSSIPIEAAGVGYGVVLFGLTLLVHKSITGKVPGSGSLAAAQLGVCLATHLVYGGVLGFLIAWL